MRTLRPFVVLLALALAACGPRGPQPIALGQESCDYCRMVVDDARFAAQLVTATGKRHVFDSIECLASYDAARRQRGERDATVWVTDFRQPGTWVPAERAVYVQGGERRSPMGYGLAAFAPESDTASLARELGGRVIGWSDVLALVERGGIREGAEGQHAH